MRGIVVIFLSVLTMSGSLAQRALGQNETEAPMVFQIGEHEDVYNELTASSVPLLQVCDEDLTSAYQLLKYMARDIQKEAFREGYDLNGVKCWVHFFWNPNGSFNHIAFYLKPASKNISPDSFNDFLGRFAKTYRVPVKAKQPFQLYTSLSFPVLIQEKQETSHHTNTQY